MKLGNKADKTLAGAALLFAGALVLKLENPQSLGAAFLLFCAEAALIGGVADWFAVTALFKKPLGFSYHTAILPRRRVQFTAACVKLVQDEFFSKKNIFRRIRRLNFLSLSLDWLDRTERKDALTGLVLQYVQYSIEQMDFTRIAQKSEGEVKNFLCRYPAQDVCANLGVWLVENDKDQELFSMALQAIRAQVQGEAGKAQIESFLVDFARKKTQNSFLSLLSGLAEMTNLLNFSDSAAALQEEVLRLLTRLEMRDNTLRCQLLTCAREVVAEAIYSPVWQNLFVQWRDALMADLKLTPYIEKYLKELSSQLSVQDTGETTELFSALQRIVRREIENGIAVLRRDSAMQNEADRLLYDMAGRTLLQAQLMVGSVVKTALDNMSDEQVNQLVYSRVEPDLLWIRMNGSIVGGAIGAILFLLLHVF